MKLKLLGILVIFTLLSCSAASAYVYDGINPNQKTYVNTIDGTVTAKYVNGIGTPSLNMIDSQGVHHYNVAVSRVQYDEVAIGYDYEYKEFLWPDGRTSINIHMI
jgi:hypothetical protein